MITIPLLKEILIDSDFIYQVINSELKKEDCYFFAEIEIVQIFPRKGEIKDFIPSILKIRIDNNSNYLLENNIISFDVENNNEIELRDIHQMIKFISNFCYKKLGYQIAYQLCERIEFLLKKQRYSEIIQLYFELYLLNKKGL